MLLLSQTTQRIARIVFRAQTQAGMHVEITKMLPEVRSSPLVVPLPQHRSRIPPDADLTINELPFYTRSLEPMSQLVYYFATMFDRHYFRTMPCARYGQISCKQGHNYMCALHYCALCMRSSRFIYFKHMHVHMYIDTHKHMQL